jgi:hypothetical protein
MSFPSIMMCAKEHTAIPNVQFVIPDVQFVIPDVQFVIRGQQFVIRGQQFVIPDSIRDPVPREPWIAGQARNDKAGPQ